MHRYARVLGRTVPELQTTLTTKDIAEAMAYERLEPFYYRDDYRIAMLCTLIANIFRSAESPPKEITDFMPFMPQRDKQKHLVNKLKGIFGGHTRNHRN